MQVDSKAVARLQRIVNTLNEVAEERIRKSEQYKHAMQSLHDKGFDTIEDASAGLLEINEKISKKELKLEEDFTDFMAEFEGEFNED